jgi:cytochrome c2
MNENLNNECEQCSDHGYLISNAEAGHNEVQFCQECNQLSNDVEAIGKALADVILFLAIKEEGVV